MAEPGAPVTNRIGSRVAKALLAGAFAVAGAALVVVLAACGGGGKTSQPTTAQITINTGNPPAPPPSPLASETARKRYVQQASTAIRVRLEKAARLAVGVGYSAPSSKAQLHAAANDLERAKKLFAEAADALAAITPPEEIAAEHRTLVASLRLTARRLDRLIEPARRGDRHGFETCCRRQPTGFEAGDRALRRMKARGYDLGLV